MMGFRMVQFCRQVCAILSASVTVENSVQQYGLRSKFIDVMHSLKHLISAVIQERWVSQITDSALDQTFATGDSVIGLHFAFSSLCTV
jgi:hypothetical protein